MDTKIALKAKPYYPDPASCYSECSKLQGVMPQSMYVVLATNTKEILTEDYLYFYRHFAVPH